MTRPPAHLPDDHALWRLYDPGHPDDVAAPDLMDLAAYLDGTATDATRNQVEAWMAVDPDALTMIAEVREDLDVETPAVAGRLLHNTWGRIAGWSVATAAALLIGFAGYHAGMAASPTDIDGASSDVLSAASFGLFDSIDSEDLAVQILTVSNVREAE